MGEDHWTPLSGMRRALLHVVVRGPFVIVAWALMLWAAAPILEWPPFAARGVLLLILALILPGVAMGHVISQGITDAAGMAGLSVTAIAIVGLCVSIWLGAEIATVFRTIGEWQIGMSKMMVAIAGSLWAVRTTLFET